MAYILVQLYLHTGKEQFRQLSERQLAFMSKEAESYPAGYAMFFIALSDYLDPPEKITVVLKDRQELEALPFRIPLDAVVCVLERSTEEYPLQNDKTTFYVCRGHTCLPPVNELHEIKRYEWQ